MPIWFSSPPVKDLVDSLNKIAQIVALIVAGYWGFHIYQQTSKPGLEVRNSVDVDVDWSAGPSSDFCLGSFTVTVKNGGITPFDITGYSVRAVLFSDADLLQSLPASKIGQPAFVNYDEVSKGAPFYKESTKDTGLVGHYPSSETRSLSWDFVFKKERDKSVYFSITPESNGASQITSWKADAVCPTSKLEGKSKEYGS